MSDGGNVAELHADVSAKVDRALQGLESVRSAFDTVTDSAKKVDAAFQTLQSAFDRFGERARRGGGDTDDLTKKINALSNEFAGLDARYAAVGGDQDAFAASMESVRDRAIALAQGLSETSSEYARLMRLAASANRAVEGTRQSADEAAVATESLTTRLQHATELMQTMAETAQAAFEQIRQGATIVDMRQSLGAQVAQTGTTLREFMAILEEASAGTVDNFTLMSLASKSFAYGVSEDADQLASLLEVVRFRSREAGISVQEGFTRAIEGIGKQEVEILDELFAIRPSDVYDRYAASIGTTADKLDDATKKQALLQEIIRSGQEDIIAAGGQIESLGERYDRMTSKMTDAANKWREIFAVAATGGGSAGGGLAGVVENAGTALQQMQVIQSALASLNQSVELSGFDRAQIQLALYTGNMGMLYDVLQRTEGGVYAWEYAVASASDQLGLTEGALNNVIGAVDNSTIAYDANADVCYTVEEVQRRVAEASDIMAIAAGFAGDVFDRLTGQSGALINALYGVMDVAYQVADAIGRIQAVQARLDPRANLALARQGQARAAAALGNADSPAEIAQAMAGIAEAEEEAIQASERLARELEQGMNSAQRSAEQSHRAIGGSARRGMSDVEKAHKKAQKEAEKAAKESAKAYEREVNKIRSAVERGIDLSINVGANDDLLRRMGLQGDAVNEAGRRLEDVVQRGLESPWVNAFEELRGKTDEEVRATAAYMQQQIDQFLRPDLLNEDAILQNARNAIQGQKNKEALVDRLTEQLLAEGYGSEDVESALGTSLGESMGRVGSASGTALVEETVRTTQEQLAAHRDTLRELGRQTASPFVEGLRDEIAGFDLIEAVAERVIEYLEATAA